MMAVSDRPLHSPTPGREPARFGPVLVCIDEGPGCEAAVAVAGFLAGRLGSTVLLATVQPAPSRPPGYIESTSVAALRGRALVARAARELDQPAEVRIVFGEPAERLLALAQREQAELIVLPAPEPARATPRSLGSVYLALAGTGSSPVVVVPRGPATAVATDGPVLCGIDGSPQSLAAARVAASLARLCDAPLRLVHIADGDDPAARTLEDAAAKLPDAGVLLVENGRPDHRLAAVAARQLAQLVVTAAHSRNDGESSPLGSISSRLARATTRPLVIVPSRH